MPDRPDLVGIPISQMPNVSLPRSSRFRRSLVFPDLKGALGPWRYNSVAIPVRGDDLTHIVQKAEEGRFDMIAHMYYQNAYFWWVIAKANGVTDPFTSPLIGDVLRIPTLTTILTVISPD